MELVDDRLGAVEQDLVEHAAMIDGLREAVASLDRRIGSLEARMDQRFLAIEARLTTLDAKMSQQFLWILGVQFTMFATVMATLLSAFVVQR